MTNQTVKTAGFIVLRREAGQYDPLPWDALEAARDDVAGLLDSPIQHWHASDFPSAGTGVPSTPLSQRVTFTLPEVRARGRRLSGLGP